MQPAEETASYHYQLRHLVGNVLQRPGCRSKLSHKECRSLIRREVQAATCQIYNAIEDRGAVAGLDLYSPTAMH